MGNFTKDVSVNGGHRWSKKYVTLMCLVPHFCQFPDHQLHSGCLPKSLTVSSQYDCFGDVAPGKVGMQTAKKRFFFLEDGLKFLEQILVSTAESGFRT